MISVIASEIWYKCDKITSNGCLILLLIKSCTVNNNVMVPHNKPIKPIVWNISIVS